MNEILRIKEVLVEKNKTSKWLADKLGITQGYLSTIVNHKKTPSIETLLEMANALEVDIRELFNPTLSDEKTTEQLIQEAIKLLDRAMKPGQ